jgi:dGTPase
VTFSGTVRAQAAELKQFLFRNLYRHPRVTETTGRAQEVVRDLFARYLAEPGEMQAGFAARTDTPRAVADYIAGMTDRYALREHERLTGRRLLPS